MLSRKRRDGDDKDPHAFASQLKGLGLLDIPHVVTIMYMLLLGGLIGVFYFGFEAMQGRGLDTVEKGGSQLVTSETIGNRGMLRSRSTYLDWQGESSEWFKRSPQGRFIFAFYEGIPSSMAGGVGPQQTEADPIKEAMKTLSLRSPSKYPFAYATVTTRDQVDTFSNILSDNFLTEEYPAVLLLDVIDGYKKYMLPLEGQFDMKNITNIDPEEFQVFIESALLQPYQNKSLKPYLRSERLEIDHDDSAADEAHNVVKSINSTFFHERLMKLQQEPEFFVVFYAPWCGHCRRFHELFRPLAKLVRRKTQAIGFYKIDSTKNDIDHPSISVARVPHVRFFSKWHDMTNPVVFDHRAKEVTEENLKAFLASHSKNGKTLARTWRVGEIDLDEL